MCTDKRSVNINLNEIYMYYQKDNLPREGWIQGCFCCDLNTSKTIEFKKNHQDLFLMYLCKDCQKCVLNNKEKKQRLISKGERFIDAYYGYSC